jgi:hypothetical protein
VAFQELKNEQSHHQKILLLDDLFCEIKEKLTAKKKKKQLPTTVCVSSL